MHYSTHFHATGRPKEDMFAVFKVSPNLQWINLDVDNWIYILQAGDKLVDPSGKPVPFRPGGALRLLLKLTDLTEGSEGRNSCGGFL